MALNDKTWQEVYNIRNLIKESPQKQTTHKLLFLLETSNYEKWVNKEINMAKKHVRINKHKKWQCI